MLQVENNNKNQVKPSSWTCSILEARILQFKANHVYRGSRPKVFCKKGVLRNFPKFTGNSQAWGLQLY